MYLETFLKQYIFTNMIRINRLVKRNKICDLLKLPHVAKVELKQGKSNQKDPSVIRVCIYLTCSHLCNESALFRNLLRTLVNKPDVSDEVYSTLKTAIRDNFIKESTCNKLNIPIPKIYLELCSAYNQEFFDKF